MFFQGIHEVNSPPKKVPTDWRHLLIKYLYLQIDYQQKRHMLAKSLSGGFSRHQAVGREKVALATFLPRTDE
jgi:hypothetical protein